MKPTNAVLFIHHHPVWTALENKPKVVKKIPQNQDNHNA
jgi:hypothetical protein